MVDIATISVVSSAVVAAGTIASNFVGGERQRKHETDLDFEKRVWQQKSEALFAVIETCNDIIAAERSKPETPEEDIWLGLALSRDLDALREQQATVNAFASSGCRSELTGLLSAMRSGGVSEGVAQQASRYWKDSQAVDLRQDWEKWEKLWDRYQEARGKAAGEHFHPDLDDLKIRAERLREEARESVRSPKE